MKPLKDSPYSYHFLTLCLLGSWLSESKSERTINLYITFRFIMRVIGLTGLVGLLLDLYLVLGDMKKMTWNLCITSLLVMITFKNEQMVYHRNTINTLRTMLHQDAESRQTPEDITIQKLALRKFYILRLFFYGCAIISIPIWIVDKYCGYYYNGKTELPIPFLVPPFIDLENDIQFNIAYFCVAFWSIVGILIFIEMELAMYSLFIQISREYTIFIKDISLLSRMYTLEGDDETDDEFNDWLSAVNVELFLPKNEVNPRLKFWKTKTLLNKFATRQATLIAYTQALENFLNKCFFQQYFTWSVLIVALTLQCLSDSIDLSGNLVYEMGYLIINVLDMYLTCLYCTRIHDQCLEVGEKIYSSLWYRMSCEFQRHVSMMILRSQHPPKITFGKFIEVNLELFLNIMFHLYSWLNLIRQFEE